MNDIETVYKHEYKTKFIIDSTQEMSRISELGIDAYERCFIIIDENVANLYERDILENLGLKKDMNSCYIHYIKPIEFSKSIEYYPTLISFLESHNAGRYDAVIAVGGGIVIDLVSFTVSTYMRGLPLFVIATTLIGQTDASTAGKTCLNSHITKNLLGTFYYPKVVYNNIPILMTCPKRITRQGLSEAFKYSLLTDGKLLSSIIEYANGNSSIELMEEIVRNTINARITIRNVDPLASNLGHTFGHAMEKYFDYSILHGDAILSGTVMAIHFATVQGLMTPEERDKIFDLMQQAHLNIYISSDLDVHRLVDFMRKDKKSSSSRLHLVLINGIGKPYRSDTPFFEANYDEVEEFLVQYMKDYEFKKDDFIEYLKGDDI